jgi:hypothetical protein
MQKGGTRIMLQSKWFTIFMAAVLFAGVAPHGNSAFSGETIDSVVRKAKQLKRAVKQELRPYRPVMGVLRTGQMTSFAAGDDGDLQRGTSWPEPRFVDHGDGTITDKVTRLMWSKDARQIPGTMNWHDAIRSCNNLTIAGYDNWRMPNVRELLSLIDYGAYKPALPENYPFVNVEPSALYWSSTTSMPHSAQAWTVGIMNGNVRRYNKTSNAYHVWAVRRGSKDSW